MKSVPAFAGQIVNDGVALNARAVENIGDKGLVFSIEYDFEFFEWTEVKILHDALDSCNCDEPAVTTYGR